MTHRSDHNGVVQEAEADEGNGVVKQNWNQAKKEKAGYDG